MRDGWWRLFGGQSLDGFGDVVFELGLGDVGEGGGVEGLNEGDGGVLPRRRESVGWSGRRVGMERTRLER